MTLKIYFYTTSTESGYEYELDNCVSNKCFNNLSEVIESLEMHKQNIEYNNTPYGELYEEFKSIKEYYDISEDKIKDLYTLLYTFHGNGINGVLNNIKINNPELFI
ncbi:MAG: hypothetical protein BV457_06435 [Thermoplasmata archaeon M9B1D]|nr:MAG: hypothetical protein BV457_06435 [Thermoplasmata archaeon M9B1D]PNX48212.1 MAG: hypothetical protein BV456_10020 [Thermoplasmata archaeon M8B2D]